MMKRKRLLRLPVCTLVLALAGCASAYEWVGIRLLYDEAPASSERVLLDVPYVEGSTLDKHRLDLLLPDRTPEDGAWPVLIFVHGSREWKSLQHQNRLLDRALRDAGAKSRLLVATQTHASIVLALTREDKLPGAAVLQFIRQSRC